MSYSYLMKFIIIGDSGVGKSCMIHQYINRVFLGSHDVTIGVDFASKIIRAKDFDGNLEKIKIQIWDTAGQETFRSITQSYYNGAAGVIIVYDITNRESFENILGWHDDVLSKCGKDTCIMFVGNKSDMSFKRKVAQNEAEELAKNLNKNIQCLETSSKSGDSIDKVFDDLTIQIFNKIKGNEKLPDGVKYINAYLKPTKNNDKEKNKKK